ncbi:MAG TPA: ABC transporter permease [Candidatus Angelobacter sp.]|nr:ABC transporter permease [Candidatus Angelobacter sp.]
MYALGYDLRFAFRQLRRAPGFTITVVLTLAIGLGATTAIFSLVESILLRPLPFRDPARLVLLGDHLGSGPNTPVTAREIGTYSKSTSAFSSMGGYISSTYELSGGATPEEVQAARVTASVFPTLGVDPILGRLFTQQEDDGHQPVAVINYAVWLNRFNRDPHVLGNSLVLDRKAYSIIGVMPQDFEFPLQSDGLDQTQIWLPMSFTPAELSDDRAGFWGFHMVARLRDDATLTQAAQDTDRVAQQIMRDFPAGLSAIHIRGDVTPLREYFVAEARPLLRILFFAVAIVLLVACVNVAGLLLARAVKRHSEYAVRLALGARSGSIIRESVLEGLLLSVSGGLLGLARAAAAIRATVHVLHQSMPRADSVSMDSSVAIFALVLALACGVLCSLAPAFAALRTNLTQSLKASVRGSGSVSHTWLRSALIVAEIAVALVLLTTSGALLRSFQKMRAVDPGFRPDHVLVARYRLPLDEYAGDSAVDAFNHAVVARISSKPGIVAAGITTALPSSGFSPEAGFTIEDQPAEKWKLKFGGFAITDGDYFRAMGMPLLEGRTFTPQDRANSPLVVIVNESMARHSWPGARALGKRMHVGGPKKALPWATVVGVVADTKLGARDEPSLDQWYSPAQKPAILYGTASGETAGEPRGGYIVLRSALPPEEMTQTLRATVAEIDSRLALREMQTMNDVIATVESPRRFNTSLITAFALGALLLAITGIYAVVSFSVSLRTHEIAIRMALGAQRNGVARLILLSGAKLALLGCFLGVAGSLAASRLVASLLFEVSATDPFIYLVGVLLMLLVSLLASALPATRAASVEPIHALRSF